MISSVLILKSRPSTMYVIVLRRKRKDVLIGKSLVFGKKMELGAKSVEVERSAQVAAAIVSNVDGTLVDKTVDNLSIECE